MSGPLPARTGPPPALPERADAAAWLAVAAGTLGALMATLDISIVNSALPTIQGEIGASGTEGTWISTSYLVSEIIAIPLSGWLQRTLGLRRLLLMASTFFTVFSVVCGLSDSLVMMIVGRVGQGFSGGMLIPTSMTIVATRLPRAQQPIGTSLLGGTALLGPVAGPILGGWLTESASWHYAFFLNLPIGVGLVTLLAVALPREPLRVDLVRDADWLGIAGLALALGGLTVVLEEGEREEWFASADIRWLAAVAAIGFAMVTIGQLTARKPVIRLSLLRDRQFGAISVMMVMVGMVSYGTSYVIPQFLVTIAGYNALQSGETVLLAAVPTLVLMPFTPFLTRTIDIRFAVATGMMLLALSAWLETDITSATTGGVFGLSQLIRGFGTMFALAWMNQAAIRSVAPAFAGDAAGITTAARNLGGSLALAGISVVQDQRVWLHSRRLEEGIVANSSDVQGYMASQAASLGGMDAAYQSVGRLVQVQALTLTYIDLFWFLAIAVACVCPLALLLRPLPRDAKPVMAH